MLEKHGFSFISRTQVSHIGFWNGQCSSIFAQPKAKISATQNLLIWRLSFSLSPRLRERRRRSVGYSRLDIEKAVGIHCGDDLGTQPAAFDAAFFFFGRRVVHGRHG